MHWRQVGFASSHLILRSRHDQQPEKVLRFLVGELDPCNIGCCKESDQVGNWLVFGSGMRKAVAIDDVGRSQWGYYLHLLLL